MPPAKKKQRKKKGEEVVSREDVGSPTVEEMSCIPETQQTDFGQDLDTSSSSSGSLELFFSFFCGNFFWGGPR